MYVFPYFFIHVGPSFLLNFFLSLYMYLFMYLGSFFLTLCIPLFLYVYSSLCLNVVR